MLVLMNKYDCKYEKRQTLRFKNKIRQILFAQLRKINPSYKTVLHAK